MPLVLKVNLTTCLASKLLIMHQYAFMERGWPPASSSVCGLLGSMGNIMLTSAVVMEICVWCACCSGPKPCNY